MVQISVSFQRAQALHQQGQLSKAKGIYEQILRVQPQHFGALHFLGMIAAQTNDPQRAVDLMGKSIMLDQQNAVAFNNYGNALLQVKRCAAAVASYDKAIALRSDYADAYYNRGVALLDLGQYPAAIASFDMAIALDAALAEPYFNRGNAYARLQQHEAALNSYDRAIAIRSDWAEAYSNRGIVLNELKRLDSALASFDRATELKPDYAEAYSGRGVVLKRLQQLEAALESYNQAIALKPDYAEAYLNRGVALAQLKRFDEALASYDQAIASKPDYPEAYSNRGNALFAIQQFGAALDSYNKAIALDPGYAEAYSNRSVAQKELGRLEESLASVNRAIAIKPDYAEAYSNRGLLFHELTQVDAALESLNRAIAIKADYAQARENRAYTRLLGGDLENGWSDYEWRWLNENSSLFKRKRNFSKPTWLGLEAISGRSILIHAEQGLGDTIQFCRYATMVAKLGATVILEVQRPLLKLLSVLHGSLHLIARGSALPDFDYHCPLLSLPLAFGTTLATVPARVPYLRSTGEALLAWRQMLGEKRKFRVGLVWSGGFRPNQPEVWAVNGRRNIPLAKFAPLKNSQVEFYSLQKGQPAESELAAVRSTGWDGPDVIDFTHLLHDFTDTAALIEHLDLVISVDTSVAHLAGALGKPVWILNRFDTCWRWLLERADSPWYPTARIYRQDRPADWDGVIQRVNSDLNELVGRPLVRG